MVNMWSLRNDKNKSKINIVASEIKLNTKSKTKVLVIGASGMLGSSIFRFLSEAENIEIYGTVRDSSAIKFFPVNLHPLLISGIEANEAGLLSAFLLVKPEVVVNCIGIVKQNPDSNHHLLSLEINATLPHRLAKYCKMIGAKLIHFSTDCVFSGKKGRYNESDVPDAYDLYGRTKLLGEVDYDNSITLRTSLIGHELRSAKSLIDWFLSQSGEVKGYKEAVFSGLPTIEIARVLKDYVLPNQNLTGMYHLSVDPINKFDLLNLVATEYGKDIKILPDEKLVIDRSLDSQRFRSATGFKPRPWPELIKEMHLEYMRIQQGYGQ